jgi:hypothetical protein
MYFRKQHMTHVWRWGLLENKENVFGNTIDELFAFRFMPTRNMKLCP